MIVIENGKIDNCSNSMVERKFINFIRGIACLLMLWGHSIQYCIYSDGDFYSNVVFKIIYSFHMPLFMSISGYLFFFSSQKRDFIGLIKDKSKSLMYSILMGSLVLLVLSPGILNGKHAYVSYVGSLNVNYLWFLWSLLSCNIALAMAAKSECNFILKTMLIMAGGIIVVLFPNYEMNLFMYPYFVIGYLFAKWKDILLPYNNMMGAICLFLFIGMIAFFERKHYIYTTGINGGETIMESLYIDSFRYVIGFLGTMATIFVGKFIFNMASCISILKIFARMLLSLGENSLSIYILSISLQSLWLSIVVSNLQGLLLYLHYNNIYIYNIIFTPIVSIIYALIFLCIVRKKDRWYVQLFFGR